MTPSLTSRRDSGPCSVLRFGRGAIWFRRCFGEAGECTRFLEYFSLRGVEILIQSERVPDQMQGVILEVFLRFETVGVDEEDRQSSG